MHHEDEHDHGGESKLAVLILVIAPWLGLALALYVTWLWIDQYTLTHLIAFLGLLLAGGFLTGFGVTGGLHRFFTHHSFKTSRAFTYVLGALGGMAVEGKLFDWVTAHMIHHRYSDTEGDLHSPVHGRGNGFWNALKSFFHAHVGWMITGPGMGAYHAAHIPRMLTDPTLVRINALFPVWVLLGLAIPTAIGFIIIPSWKGALLGFLWGGVIRILIVNHITWSVNSVCHLWGTRVFDTEDHSRNNWFFGFFGLGEGWHHNHHAFQASARHGLWWWQIDATWIVLKLLSWIGIVWDLKVPSIQQINRKLVKPTTSP